MSEDRAGKIRAIYRCRRCAAVFEEPGNYVTRFANMGSNRQAVWREKRPDTHEHPCNGDWCDATEWGVADKIGCDVELKEDQNVPLARE